VVNVTRARPNQFRVEMPHGLVIERLPVGLARGVWRVAFVASGADFLAGEPPRAIGFHQEFRERVRLDGVGAPLVGRGSGGGGRDDEQELRFNYLDNGLTALRVTYTYEGTVVASEVVDLSD
jgi:hypothetical protein